MKVRVKINLFIFSILLLFSVKTMVGQSGTITIDQDPKIAELLTLKKTMEKENKLSDGFTIQLYYGELNDANNVIRKYRNSSNTWPASIEYETPNYKVWVGSYSSRIEADRALLEIQKLFPSAFILKPERKK